MDDGLWMIVNRRFTAVYSTHYTLNSKQNSHGCPLTSNQRLRLTAASQLLTSTPGAINQPPRGD